MGNENVAKNTSVTPLLFRNINDILYGYALSSALRSAWVYEPSVALDSDADIWEVVRRDVTIMGSMKRRRSGVVKPYQWTAPGDEPEEGDKRVAGIINEACLKIDKFNEARRILSDAHILGRQYLYIESEIEHKSLDGGPKMDWEVPKRLRHVDRRRFHWIAREGRRADNTPFRRTWLSFYNSITSQWQDVTPAFRNHLVEYVYEDTEDRVGYGRGLLEAIFYYHYFKTVAIQRNMEGLDRWANGILIGKIDTLRNASTGKTNEDLRQGMEDVLTNMRTNHVVTLGKEDDIDVKETSGQGYQMMMGTIKYYDDSIERLLNGSVRAGGMGPEKTGARAASDTEQDEKEAYYQDDREDCDEVTTRDLGGWFFSRPRNRMNLQKLGLLEDADNKCPKFISRHEKKQDPKEALETAKMMVNELGEPVLRRELYRKSGYSRPKEGDDVVERKMDILNAGMGFDSSGEAHQDFDSAQREEAAKEKAKLAGQKPNGSKKFFDIRPPSVPVLTR